MRNVSSLNQPLLNRYGWSMTSAIPHRLLEEDWDALLFAIGEGTCIPMLGPDFVTRGDGAARLPLLRGFGEELRQSLDSDPPLPADAGLAEIAEAYSRVRGRNRIVARAKSYFSEQDVNDPALEALLAIPFPLVVSAMPGPRVEQVMATKPTVGHYNYRGGRPGLLPEWSPEKPLVYHLLGSIEEPNSLVYSDSDLLDFLVAIVSKSPGLPNNLASAFRDPKHSFLFLGFGLRHWHRRVLMHVMAAQQNRESASYALEELDSGAPQSVISVHSVYEKDYRVQFFEMEPHDFALELSRRYQATAGHTPRVPPPEVAPLQVFICHASEDAEQAAQLTTDLESRGIPVWLDKDDLRGGDRWNEEIERAIRNDITHFVVLQSQHLYEKEEGYVNKEISIALDRDRTFRSSLKFVVPVLLDGSHYALEELSEIHNVDLEAADAVDDLATLLLRDGERRRARKS